VLVPIALAYAWWATDLRPFTLPSLAAVLAGGVVAMTVGSRLLPPRPPPAARRRRPRVWAGLGAALGVWELVSFVQRPRAEHPTVSSLANDVFERHPARALGLSVWLVAAAALARLKLSWPGRLLLLGAWLWLGWHLFVRAGY
jgi:hypothetical protein